MVQIASSAVDLSTMDTAVRASQSYDFASSDRDDHDDRAAETSGNPLEPIPTLLFRLALSLRRCGATAEADILFSKSSRMLADEYVTARLRASRELAMRPERAA